MENVERSLRSNFGTLDSDSLRLARPKACPNLSVALARPMDNSCMRDVPLFNSAMSDDPDCERVHSVSQLLDSSDDETLINMWSNNSLKDARNSITGEPIFCSPAASASMASDHVPLCVHPSPSSSSGAVFSHVSPHSSTLSEVDFEWLPCASVSRDDVRVNRTSPHTSSDAKDTARPPQPDATASLHGSFNYLTQREDHNDSVHNSLVASCSLFLLHSNNYSNSKTNDNTSPSAVPITNLSPADLHQAYTPSASSSVIDPPLRQLSPGSAPILPVDATAAEIAAARMQSQCEASRLRVWRNHLAELDPMPYDENLFSQAIDISNMANRNKHVKEKEKVMTDEEELVAQQTIPDNISSTSTYENGSDEPSSSVTDAMTYTSVFHSVHEKCKSIKYPPKPSRSKSYMHSTTDARNLKVPNLQSHGVTRATNQRSSSRYTEQRGTKADEGDEAVTNQLMWPRRSNHGAVDRAETAVSFATQQQQQQLNKTPEQKSKDMDNKSDSNDNKNAAHARSEDCGQTPISQISSTGSRANFFVQRAQQLNLAALSRQAKKLSTTVDSSNWIHAEQGKQDGDTNNTQLRQPSESYSASPFTTCSSVTGMNAREVGRNTQSAMNHDRTATNKIATPPLPALRRLSLCALSPHGSASAMSDAVGTSEPVRVDSDLFVKDYTRPHTSAARLRSDNANSSNPNSGDEDADINTNRHDHSSSKNNKSAPNLSYGSSRDGCTPSPSKPLWRNTYEIVPDMRSAPESTSVTSLSMQHQRSRSAHQGGSENGTSHEDSVAQKGEDRGVDCRVYNSHSHSTTSADDAVRSGWDKQGHGTALRDMINLMGQAKDGRTVSSERPIHVFGLGPNRAVSNFSLNSELIRAPTRDPLTVNTSLSTTSWPSNNRMDQNELSQTRGIATTNPQTAWRLISFSEQKSVPALHVEPVNGNPASTNHKSNKHKDRTKRRDKRGAKSKKHSSKDPNKRKCTVDDKQQQVKPREAADEVTVKSSHTQTPLSSSPQTQLQHQQQYQQQSQPQHPRAGTPISPPRVANDAEAVTAAAAAANNKKTLYDGPLSNGHGIQRQQQQYTTMHRPAVELLLHNAKRNEGCGGTNSDWTGCEVAPKNLYAMTGNYKMPAVPKNELVNRHGKSNSIRGNEDVPRRRSSGSGGVGNNNISSNHSGGLDGVAGRKGSGVSTARETLNSVNTDQYDKQYLGTNKIASQRSGVNSARVTSDASTTVRRTTIRTTLFRLANQGLALSGLGRHRAPAFAGKLN